MKSKIFLEEEVKNKERRFGSDSFYIPVIIVNTDGYNGTPSEKPALFTNSQIDVATERAARNPEDIPEDITFFEHLMKVLKS